MRLLNEPGQTPATLEEWEITVLRHFNAEDHSHDLCRACGEWQVAYSIGRRTGYDAGEKVGRGVLA